MLYHQCCGNVLGSSHRSTCSRTDNVEPRFRNIDKTLPNLKKLAGLRDTMQQVMQRGDKHLTIHRDELPDLVALLDIVITIGNAPNVTSTPDSEPRAEGNKLTKDKHTILDKLVELDTAILNSDYDVRNTQFLMSLTAVVRKYIYLDSV